MNFFKSASQCIQKIKRQTASQRAALGSPGYGPGGLAQGCVSQQKGVPCNASPAVPSGTGRKALGKPSLQGIHPQREFSPNTEALDLLKGESELSVRLG